MKLSPSSVDNIDVILSFRWKHEVWSYDGWFIRWWVAWSWRAPSTWQSKQRWFWGWSLIMSLNSGIFWIFDPREWNLNLNSSDSRASKIIWNDTKPEPMSRELNIENQILNFCVGVWVGGHNSVSFHTDKRSLAESTKRTVCVLIRIKFSCASVPQGL